MKSRRRKPNLHNNTSLHIPLAISTRHSVAIAPSGTPRITFHKRIIARMKSSCVCLWCRKDSTSSLESARACSWSTVGFVHALSLTCEKYMRVVKNMELKWRLQHCTNYTNIIYESNVAVIVGTCVHLFAAEWSREQDISRRIAHYIHTMKSNYIIAKRN